MTIETCLVEMLPGINHGLLVAVNQLRVAVIHVVGGNQRCPI